ncbi:POTE ankyrin domain family member B2-like [Calypte anna]|uniref:POTE ankyrin domain family member B2-like n=1 Tax=Calypte anna TaxID=9244 RepID=UPI0011C39ED2|nr:POTE ankyrin domain family member B2-like [Calypte anna]
MGLFTKKQKLPRSGSAPGQPCGAAAAGTGAPEPQYQGLGRLHRAAARGHLAWLRRWRWWMEIWGIDRRDRENRTPLHLACANGHTEVVTFLVRHRCQLDAADNFGTTPLMMAVQFQHQACAGFLLKCGADPNLRDFVGNTALHLAVLSCNLKVVELLVDHNANLDAKNKEGFTPLSLAVSKGQAETAEFLLRMGADVHARDQQQRTPLMMAASVGKMKLIRVLLHHGADISHKGPYGLTAADYACNYGYPRISEKLSESAAPKKGEAARAGVEDSSKGGLKRSEKKGIGDGWSASAEQLDLTPKKQQEPKVTRCMKAFQQGRKTSSLPPVEEVEKAEDFLWTSPWDSEEKTPEQHKEEEKKELDVELKTAIAGCTEKYFLNGSPDEPNTTCSENSGEHSGSTFHVSSPAEKKSPKGSQPILRDLPVAQKCRELEEQQLRYEHQIHGYKDRKRKLREKSQKLKDLLSSSSETRATVKELEERVQCLSMENARLEGTVQQQRRMIEALEGTLQASASIHDRLEDLMTSLGASRAAAEEQHQQQLQKQIVPSLPSKDLHSVRKKRLKPRLHPGDHGSPLGRRKNELLKQLDELFWKLELEPEAGMQGEIQTQASGSVSRDVHPGEEPGATGEALTAAACRGAGSFPGQTGTEQSP